MSMTTLVSRPLRIRYLLLCIATIAAGLAIHLGGAALPVAVRDIAGDALWAAMIFWMAAVIAPAAQRRWLMLAAIAISFAVELSQLVRADWLETWRSTTLGHLILGSDFDARDLLAYSVGVVAAALLDLFLMRHHR
jgi:hypothetical protein